MNGRGTIGRGAIAGLALALALALPGLAQEEPATSPVPPSRFGVQSYEPKLLRFLELIGSVQFLRQLCAPGEGTSWRDNAAAIIEAEGDTARRKERLTAAFNRGYRAFSAYSQCNDAAIYAIDRYMREGEALGRDLLVRYGE